MKSILKSSTFWIAFLMIAVNVLEMVVKYSAEWNINPLIVNIIMGVIFILNRIRPKEAMNVWVFNKPKNAEAAK